MGLGGFNNALGQFTFRKKNMCVMPATAKDFNFASLASSMIFGGFTGVGSAFLGGESLGPVAFNVANTMTSWFFAAEGSIFQRGVQYEQERPNSRLFWSH